MHSFSAKAQFSVCHEETINKLVDYKYDILEFQPNDADGHGDSKACTGNDIGAEAGEGMTA